MLIEHVFLIMAFIVGILYRFSEIEYIWQYSTWRWKGKKQQPTWLRKWVTKWMRGDINKGQPGEFWWGFNRFTFSFFEDGYHFFGNFKMLLPYIFAFICVFYSIPVAWWAILMYWPVRSFGTSVGRKMILEEVNDRDIHGRKLEDNND